jgi:UDP-N-acetylmuramoyl-L-alanyl-D-glutamate--2,6-diaminopimelate ligase
MTHTPHSPIPSLLPVTAHTQYVGPGSTFVAIKGYREDGVQYIPQALAQGATTIVVASDAMIAHDLRLLIAQHHARLIEVPNDRKALAQLSAQAHGYPTDKLKIIGITGTKGKTSTTFILEHMLRTAGYKTALLSGVKNSINGVDTLSSLTTPQPDYLHAFFAACVKQSVAYVVMEVAAQAMSLHRVDGINFDGIIFTNFSQEHGEFYATMDDYFAAKCDLFKQLKQEGVCLINADDPHGNQILAAHPTFVPYQLCCEQNAPTGARASWCIRWRDSHYQFQCPALIGHFNGYNVVAAGRMALALGLEPATIAQALYFFTGVPGRLERYHLSNGAMGVIDYAHNPSSCAAVLSTLRVLTHHLVVVFGCGGDRDSGKRPMMGSIAAQYADLIIITTDNPRSEDPATIVDAIYAGIPVEHQEKVVRELDREKAILCAYQQSKQGSIIALLGKGPDEYQQIGATKYPFSEKKILQSIS